MEKFSNLDWKEIQNQYDNGLSQVELMKKFSFSRRQLDSAKKHNLFIANPDRRYGHEFSEETKKQISQKRKQFLKENPDKHPWKKLSKFRSEPCERLKQILKEKEISFFPEFTDPEWEYNYSIDIAFPNDKIGIEVNGNQHYDKNGHLTSYYQNRENYLKSLGWTLYQIHYSLIYNQSLIENLICFIKENVKDFNLSNYFVFLNKTFCKDCGKKLKKSESEYCYSCLLKQKIEERKMIILNSGITFSKYGWVSKLSKILKITPQKTSQWVMKHLPEFYEKDCYKRKK